MDIRILVRGITGVLIPCLPVLLQLERKTVEQGVDTLGKQGTEALLPQANKLWDKLQPAVRAKPGALEAVEDVANSPEDGDAIASLRQQLKKILAAPENGVLVAEVAEILAESKSEWDVTVSGDGNQVMVLAQGGLVNAAKGWSGEELAQELDRIVLERR